MKRVLILVVLLVPVVGVSVAATPAQPEPRVHHPIVGKWTWTRETNNCTEVYDFRPDGTTYVTSGEERSDGKYSISFAPDPNGFFKLEDTVVKDYGGRDCADSDEDSTGHTAGNYILFSRARDQHIVCKEPKLEACFGPLRRLPEK